MKSRIISFIIAVLMLFLSAPSAVFADSNELLTFQLSADGTYYTVTDCDRAAEHIVIPSEYKNLPVKKIGIGAFSFCENLSEVDIPNSVEVIDNHAFAHSGLTKVILPTSITKISRETFFNCAKLESVFIPTTVSDIEFQAFSKCVSLTEIVIPISVEWMGNYVFWGCKNLENILCHAPSKPKGWQEYWYTNKGSKTVWGYFDENSPTPVCGDIDSNGVIDADDVILLKRVCLGIRSPEQLSDTENSLFRCDVNKNTKIDIGDYILLKRAFFGMCNI